MTSIVVSLPPVNTKAILFVLCIFFRIDDCLFLVDKIINLFMWIWIMLMECLQRFLL